MAISKSLALTVACSVAAASFWFGKAEATESVPTDLVRPAATTVQELNRLSSVPVSSSDNIPALVAIADTAAANQTQTKPVLSLKYGDGKPDGKKSIAGTGEMIRFTLPDSTQHLRSVRVHCARYGLPTPPDEDVEISITSEDGADIVHTELVPYAKFKRGESRWTTIAFEDPIDVPDTFWVIMEFNAARTKGVYVSYDSSTDGSNSKTGLPGGSSKDVTFDGDWMVQAILTKPE